MSTPAKAIFIDGEYLLQATNGAIAKIPIQRFLQFFGASGDERIVVVINSQSSIYAAAIADGVDTDVDREIYDTRQEWHRSLQMEGVYLREVNNESPHYGCELNFVTLAVDILEAAHKGQSVVFFGGSRCILPALESALRMTVSVSVYCVEGHVAPELIGLRGLGADIFVQSRNSVFPET